MGIKDYFKPGWKSNDAAVREEFIKNISASPDVKELVLKVLGFEKLPKLRKLALKKINDLDTVSYLLNNVTEQKVKEEVKDYLEKLIAKKYLENTLEDEKYLDYLGEDTEVIELFIKVNSIHQKKKLIPRVKSQKNLFGLLNKINLKNKELIYFILEKLEGKYLIDLLDNPGWENLRKKYFTAILNYFKKNENEFSAYESAEIGLKEEQIISHILQKKQELEISKKFHFKDRENLFNWASDEFTCLNEKRELTAKIKEALDLYQNVFVKIKNEQELNNKILDTKKYLEKLGREVEELKENLFKDKLNELTQSLDDQVSQLDKEVLQEANIKAKIEEIKSSILEKKNILQEKERKEKIALEQKNDQKDKLKKIEATTLTLAEKVKELEEGKNYDTIEEISAEVEKEKSDFEKFSDSLNAEEFPSLSSIKKRFVDLIIGLENVRSKYKEQKDIADLKEEVEKLEQAEAKGETDLSALKEKVPRWEKILEKPKVAKFFTESEIIRCQKLFLQVRKKIDEKEFRDIQSFLDRKRSLLKDLSHALTLEDKFDILQCIFEIKKKWFRIPNSVAFYFRSVNSEFNSLLRACEEKSKAVKQQFEAEQEKKVARKKELLEKINSILEENKEEKITFTKVEEVKEIIEEWKTINVYSLLNLREINLEFKQKINAFFKIKQSSLIEQKKEKEKNYNQKKKYLNDFQLKLKNFKNGDWGKKLSFLIEERKNWFSLKLNLSRKESRELDDEFFQIIEAEFVERANPVSHRKEKIEAAQKELVDVLKKESLSLEEFKKAKVLFASSFNLLKESFLPQKEYQIYFNNLNDFKKEFDEKNLVHLEQEKKELTENKKRKEELLKELAAINEKKVYDKENNEAVKKINQEWQSLPFVTKKIDPNLEKNYRQEINNFYNQLRSKIKTEKGVQEKNFLTKKKILDRLEYLIDLDGEKSSEQNIITNENFDVSRLKEIWEYNRQFKAKDGNKSEKRKEVFTLLKEWSNKLDISFSQRKKLDERFKRIRKLLQKKGYVR